MYSIGQKKDHKSEKTKKYIILCLLYVEVMVTSRNTFAYTSKDCFLIHNYYSHYLGIREPTCYSECNCKITYRIHGGV